MHIRRLRRPRWRMLALLPCQRPHQHWMSSSHCGASSAEDQPAQQNKCPLLVAAFECSFRGSRDMLTEQGGDTEPGLLSRPCGFCMQGLCP